MLAPHDGENAQLREVRLATEDRFDALVFVGRDAVLGDDGGCDLRLGHGWKMEPTNINAASGFSLSD